jgi:putative SOS response-associated peptidase YedK
VLKQFSEGADSTPVFWMNKSKLIVPTSGSYDSGRRRARPSSSIANEGRLFAFAGIREWKGTSGNWVKTCSILTTTPNSLTSVVHDRMPVILDSDCYDLWLDPEMHHVRAVSDMLKPFDARLMACYPVSNESATWPMMMKGFRLPWQSLRSRIRSFLRERSLSGNILLPLNTTRKSCR